MKDDAVVFESIKVEKRNGIVTTFNFSRITQAIGNAFKQADGLPREAALSEHTLRHVEKVSGKVVDVIKARANENQKISVEDIQDEVIRQLYENGYKEIAELYADYRKRHAEDRDLYNLYKTVKRDGKVVSFKPEKITMAIAKAFRATNLAENTYYTLDEARKLATKVVERIENRWPDGAHIHIETLQDMVETTFMEEGYYEVAKRYIVYREKRKRARGVFDNDKEVSFDWIKDFKLKLKDGTEKPLDIEELRFTIQTCCDGLENVSADHVLAESLKNYYNGITEDQVFKSNIMATRSFIEKEPNYSYVAARLLLLSCYQEAIGTPVSFAEAKIEYQRYFPLYIKKAVEYELLHKDLLDFDLKKLAKHLKCERDFDFKYLGLQTLYDRYFFHWEGQRLELPQCFWMRVAMGLAKREGKDKNKRAIEFYEILSSRRFVSSTPTLFNSGTLYSQLSSCYLTTVDDDLHHIFKCIQDDAMLSKWSGGLGNDWTRVRAMGARIKGTNGKSQGVIPFLKVANDTAVAVNQGGKRKGAMCAYLETWHMDIEEFLELRKNTGDDRRRTHDMHTANWIPDLFLSRVKENKDWSLFSPNEVPDLHDLYGKAFQKRYEEYEKLGQEGKLRSYKKIPALQLWRKMLTQLFETGHPWITFKDPSNVRSPQDHVGVVHSSNLCTEILLNTSNDETAVCNLGSVNLSAHTTKEGLDEKLLQETIQVAMRMLDNVVDINYYPTKEAEASNLKHRPVGLGIMGFQDALYKQGFSYASPEAVTFADKSMEMVSYYAILGSTELAAERGTYSSYQGSKWDRGLLPIDTIDLLEEERGQKVQMDRSKSLDWDKVRTAIKKNGMRNSNVMAIAPTATIANISGVTQSIEPTYKNLFVKSNLSGEFTVVNEFLIEDLKKLDMWDEEMINDLKYFDGSVQEIDRIPQDIKMKYVTAFEIDYDWYLMCASRRQKWIDMGQSLNLYQAHTSGKKLSDMYLMAWEMGLKTTYYLRTMGATRIEKSTLDVNKYGNVLGKKEKGDKTSIAKKTDEPKPATMYSVMDESEDCESCQ